MAQLNNFKLIASWDLLGNSWNLPTPWGACFFFFFHLWLFDSLLCVLFVTCIVGGSNRAWFLALTVHVIALFVVQLNGGNFPKSALWWRLLTLSGVHLETLSTYFKGWNELRTTFLNNMLEQQKFGEVRNEKVEMKSLALLVQWSCN